MTFHDLAVNEAPADATPMLAMENIGDLDPAILSEVLIEGGHANGLLTKVDVEPIGLGLLGSSYRLGLSYSTGTTGPSAIVLKMHGNQPSARKIARYGYRIPGGFGFYGNETAFYQSLASRVSIRVPKCFGAAISVEGARFMLLLESIEPAIPGNDLADCPVRNLELAVANIARLHGPSWGIKAQQLDPRIYDSRGFHSAVMQGHMQAACKVNAQRWSDEFDSAMFDRFSRFADFYDQWQRADGRPYSIIHTDHRLDNILYFSNREEVVVVDWQTLQLGMPLRDVGQLLAASVSEEMRRTQEQRVLHIYHDELCAAGVENYSFDALLSDYYWSLLQGLHGCMFGMATISLEGRGRNLFLTKLRRTLAALQENRDKMEFDLFA